jgi:hypothetical protein
MVYSKFFNALELINSGCGSEVICIQPKSEHQRRLLTAGARHIYMEADIVTDHDILRYYNQQVKILRLLILQENFPNIGFFGFLENAFLKEIACT